MEMGVCMYVCTPLLDQINREGTMLYRTCRTSITTQYSAVVDRGRSTMRERRTRSGQYTVRQDATRPILAVGSRAPCFLVRG